MIFVSRGIGSVLMSSSKEHRVHKLYRADLFVFKTALNTGLKIEAHLGLGLDNHH